MAPMPDVVLTSSSTGPISSVVPPASAFQSPIRILKRSATSTQNSANDDASASAITETFAERSARYNAARERIFAGTTEGSVDSGDGIPVPVSAIIRNPKGPEYAQGKDREGSQGFGVRAGKRGSLSQKQGQQLQGSDLRTE
jgi:SUZ domain